MKFNLPPKIDEQTEDSTYWISISDLMAGLLIIFILTLTYYMLTYSQKTDRITDNDRVRREILETVKGQLKREGILDVKIDSEHGVLRFPDGILFDPGRADIKPEGQQVIGVLGPILGKVLTTLKYRGRVETVFIEGHTDSIPMIPTPRIKDNWELSTKRAIVAWDSMRSVAPALGLLVNQTGQSLFSCSGYADTRPIASNGEEGNRSKNRRIDLRFAMSPPQKDTRKPIVRSIQSLISKTD